MISAGISSVSTNFYDWFPKNLPSVNIFPDFSYVQKKIGLESWEDVYEKWKQNPDVFIEQLLLGKIPPVRVESYLKAKSEGELKELFDKAFQIAMSTDHSFNLEQLLRGSALMMKVEELSDKIIRFKKGYPAQRESLTKTQRKMYRTKIFFTFLPNLIDTFLKALNLLDAGKRPESVWDYNAMISIYLTILAVPFGFMSLALQLTAVPHYAFMIALGLTCAAVALLYVYVSWLRPMPHDFPSCENVHDILTSFFADRRKQIEQCRKAIEAGQNVIIVGDTGCGKTALAYEVGKCVKKTMQVVSDGVFEETFLSPVLKLQMDFAEAQNDIKKVFFLFDESSRLAGNENMVKFIQRQMDGGIQLLAVCETNEYREKIESKPQLDGRFTTKIFLKPLPNVELTEILASFYHAEGGDVDCSESLQKIVQHVIDETNKHKDKMRCRQQPAVAMSVWRKALSGLKYDDSLNYEETEGEKSEQEENATKALFPSLSDEEQESALAKLDGLVKENRQNVQQSIQKIKKWSSLRVAIRRQLQKETMAFERGDTACMRRWAYLKHLQKPLEQALLKEEQSLPKGMTLRLNTAYIDSIIKGMLPEPKPEPEPAQATKD